MILSQNETQRFINLVLSHSIDVARITLHHELAKIKFSEAEFCAGVMAHGQGIKLSSDEWFDLLQKVPNKLLAREKWLLNKLTENQLQQLRLK